MKTSLKIALGVLGAVGVLLLALITYFFTATAGVKLDPEKLTLTQNCIKIFDGKGEELETAARENILLSDLPAHVPNAFVAVEDKRFYSHSGLDLKRIAKAAMKNLASLSFREGASTISQQLIKNTHLSGEKTLSRKLKEFRLTRALEKRYTKEEILELYLNSIYFGHSAFGVENAAKFYFGRSASTLSPAEGAMLAALVKSPNRYSPFRDAEKCFSRRNFVLSLMEEQGYLTHEEAETAKQTPLPASPCVSKKSAYLDLVFDELAELLPDAEGNLKVYTYLDGGLQSALEETDTGTDVCLLVRDNPTGGIKAFHSTCGRIARLPASTIKPIGVYAPAIEENLISPATPVLDEKTDFGGYSPSDHGGKYGGYMSVRYALAHSVNVPAVKILNSLGVEKAAGYLEKLGMPVPEEDRTLALALGGMSKGYPLGALADGYACLANGGVYSPASAIKQVEDGAGKTLYRHDPAPKRVFSADTATLVNDMLRTAVKEGTAKKLCGLPYEISAKTGTGGGAKGNSDAYTIAYTSADTIAAWMGNADGSPIEAMGGGMPANLVLGVCNRLYKEAPPAPLARSEEAVTAAIDREEYENNHRLLLADPLAPDTLSLRELFRSCALPEGKSERFSHPTIQMPQISVVNGSVKIVLCQAEYYDYEVKRQCGDNVSTLYKGKYRRELYDNSVCGGENYVYSVTPYFRGVAGETVTLPSVHIEAKGEIPDDWWE